MTVGVQITISATTPDADVLLINNENGIIVADEDGVRVIADSPAVIATGEMIIENSGLIQSTATGRGINFDLSVSPPGSITIINHETGVIAAAAGEAIFIAGGSANAIITNEGEIIGAISTADGNDTFNLFTGSSISGLLDSGSGSDTINLDGSGQGTLENFQNVEVINVLGGAWTVNLQDGQQVLRLSPTVQTNHQTINNFASGDIIDLAGIGLATSATLGANNVLTIAGGAAGPIKLQLDPAQNFSGQVFQLTSDGAGGTNITLLSAITNTGTISVTDADAIGLFVSAVDPAVGWSITNSGSITTAFGGDGVHVTADPFNPALTATGTFVIDNSGNIQATGSGINFDIPLSSPGSVTIINRATGVITGTAGEAIVIAGDSADTITNEGTITGAVLTAGGNDTFNLFTNSSISGLLDSGAGTDTINLDGSGPDTLENFQNVEIINVVGGAWTVNLQDGQQVLRLSTSVLADGQYDGTINNFASGDIIDLAGIGLATSATLGANNLLTIAGGAAGPITLQLDPAQNFFGQGFQLTSDGAGGTNITLLSAITNTNTGTISATDADAIGLFVSATDPAVGWSITNSGSITTAFGGDGVGGDGVHVTADPFNPALTATGTFIIDNSGNIQATGSGINFDIPLSSPGSVTIINRATGVITGAAGEAIVIAGDSADTITNEYTITGAVLTAGGNDTFNLFTGSSISGLLDSGAGTDTINLDGSGQGVLQSFANVEIINLYDGDWTLGDEGVNSVNFQAGLQTLSLGTTVLAGGFDGTINNFSSDDIIDLTGIGLATSATLDASNVLTIVGGSAGPITLQLDPNQSFEGQQFLLTSDGAAGTNITLVAADGSANPSLVGTAGDDMIIGGSADDVINGRSGSDNIDGGSGDDVIQTGDGDSVLNGGRGRDLLIVGNGDNTLNGGADSDTLNVGAGSNFLTGGKGSDTFMFGPNSGDNVIADFSHNDTIQIDGVFADFQALQDASEQVGDDTVIHLDADHSITLLGVLEKSLHASDFLFVA